MKHNAKASSSSTTSKDRKRVHRLPSPDDEILETDSEVDEFAEGYTDVEEGSVDEEVDQESGEEEGVGQWAPDDWEAGSGDRDEDSEEAEGDEEDDDAVQMRKLQKDLTSLPLSTLLKAQKAMQPDDSDSDSASPPPERSTKEQRLAQIKARLADLQRSKGKAVTVASHAVAGSDDEAESSYTARKREKERMSREAAAEAERIKREHKHAPMAMSSKKQVSRSRQVVEVKKVDRRDPRFNSLSAGQVDLHLHSQAYEFLPDLLKTEMSQLRQTIKTAQKAEKTCTLAEKPSRTAAREELEMQLGKLRTRLERGLRAQREREALSKAKREEREKRGEGKGAWYMKDSEKRDLLLKSRFTDLESRGGKTAVKKAIEKKQKKVAGKEKKSRPFARGQGGASFGGGDGGEDGPRKRRRAG